MNSKEAVSSWVTLRRRAVQLSILLVKALQDSMRNRGAEPDEQYRLGRVTLECLRFRRSLLEKKRGPKWREEERLRKMEQKVDSIMTRLEKTRQRASSSRTVISHLDKTTRPPKVRPTGSQANL